MFFLTTKASMKIKKIKNLLSYIAAIGISIFLLFFVITCSWIGYEVKKNCAEAQREYQGDCVESLQSLLQDENKSYRLRNSTIWALGQLGDRRALATLEDYYTGNIPDREPLDETISQYELKKAINLAEGGFNISAIIWKNNF